MQEQHHKQALPAGHRLRGYRVVAVLGVGGFGVTYLAEHMRLGHRVAIKEYLPNEFAVRAGATVHPKSDADRDSFEWGLDRFLDEAKTLARFEHRNLVRVRDYFEANRTAYIVMDYEEGESLEALLGQHGRLSEAQLRRLLRPIVEGLRALHAAGYLHRDIKPANVYVRRSDESPVLLDFGAARQALGRKSRSLTAVASTGYSPPEQYESEGEQGPWTDIYALSALCYRAISGEAPVEAPRRQGRLLRGQTDPLARLSETVKEGYTPELLAAVDWGLQVIETQRPGSLEAWVEAMGGARAPSPERDVERRRVIAPGGTPQPGVRRRRKAGIRGMAWATAVGVVMGVGAWWLIVNQPGDPRDPPQGGLAETSAPELLGGGRAIVVVTTEPPGVQVLIGGELAGLTPLELSNVRAGTHDVVLRHPDYETLALADQPFADGVALRIERTLVRGTGRLTVVTQPRAAWVERDGVRLAQGTPVTLDDLPAGSVSLRLGAAEHRAQDVMAEVPKDAVGLLEWTLEPIAYGTLTLELVPADAEVQLPDVSAVYQAGVRLPEGPHRVVVSRAGYRETERTVAVSGETLMRIELEVAPQPFMVETSPAQAQVELIGHAEAYASGMLLEPGEYQLRVSAAGYEPWEGAVRHGSEPTRYPVTLVPDGSLEVVDFTADVSTVGSLAVNGTATGEIGFNGDEDWFRVELVAGEAYQIDLEGSPTDAGTLPDPYLRGVYSAQGDGFSDTDDDDDGEGTNSRATFTAPQSGVYYLSAGAYGGSVGTYALSLALRADDFTASISTVGTVAVNGSATGEIEFDGDRDWFRVELAAGQTYRIDLEGNRTGSGTLSDPYLRGVYDAAGDALADTSNDDGGRGNNARVRFRAPQSGVYYLSAGGFSSRTGTYTLSVAD